MQIGSTSSAGNMTRNGKGTKRLLQFRFASEFDKGDDEKNSDGFRNAAKRLSKTKVCFFWKSLGTNPGRGNKNDDEDDGVLPRARLCCGA
jgi:hypothetical protein